MNGDVCRQVRKCGESKKATHLGKITGPDNAPDSLSEEVIPKFIVIECKSVLSLVGSDDESMLLQTLHYLTGRRHANVVLLTKHFRDSVNEIACKGINFVFPHLLREHRQQVVMLRHIQKRPRGVTTPVDPLLMRFPLEYRMDKVLEVNFWTVVDP